MVACKKGIYCSDRKSILCQYCRYWVKKRRGKIVIVQLINNLGKKWNMKYFFLKREEPKKIIVQLINNWGKNEPWNQEKEGHWKDIFGDTILVMVILRVSVKHFGKKVHRLHTKVNHSTVKFHKAVLLVYRTVQYNGLKCISLSAVWDE